MRYIFCWSHAWGLCFQCILRFPICLLRSFLVQPQLIPCTFLLLKLERLLFGGSPYAWDLNFSVRVSMYFARLSCNIFYNSYSFSIVTVVMRELTCCMESPSLTFPSFFLSVWGSRRVARPPCLRMLDICVSMLFNLRCCSRTIRLYETQFN